MDLYKAAKLYDEDCEYNCEKCPLNKTHKLSHDGAGFEITYTICSFFNLITETLKQG